jgi:hypothetical protein
MWGRGSNVDSFLSPVLEVLIKNLVEDQSGREPKGIWKVHTFLSVVLLWMWQMFLSHFLSWAFCGVFGEPSP